MGTVGMELILLDDERVAHTFLLKEVIIYLKDSPANLLSTRRLADLFCDKEGGLDRRGTGITSVFEEHSLSFGNRRNFRRLFILLDLVYQNVSSIPAFQNLKTILHVFKDIMMFRFLGLWLHPL